MALRQTASQTGGKRREKRTEKGAVDSGRHEEEQGRQERAGSLSPVEERASLWGEEERLQRQRK